MAFGWKLYGDGKTLPLGEAVAPDERLTWPRTVGIGAQHVVAMFGATFVFPLLMGLDPNLAIMMSGVATILFLLIVQGRVPSYLGSSASFVGGVVAVRAAGGSDADVLGALPVSGVVLALVGVVIHLAGVRVINRVLPPAVTGAVVPLIGFSLPPVATATYWSRTSGWRWRRCGSSSSPRAAARLPGPHSTGWAWCSATCSRSSLEAEGAGPGYPGEPPRPGGGGAGPGGISQPSGDASWFGLPELTTPSFSVNFSLLVLPAVIALVAENAGHVKARGRDDPARPRPGDRPRRA